MISVEQRFFNQAGHEQLGLRTVTELLVAVGGQYHVPSAGPGYTDIRCEDVGATSEVLINEGHGDFEAGESSGVHLACYQQTPGTPGGPSTGPPGIVEPKVLPVAQSDLNASDEPATFDAVPARAEPGLVSVPSTEGGRLHDRHGDPSYARERTATNSGLRRERTRTSTMAEGTAARSSIHLRSGDHHVDVHQAGTRCGPVLWCCEACKEVQDVLRGMEF